MDGECGRWRLGFVLAGILGVALSARSVGAAPTLGMVSDNASDTVTVFNADTDTIIGSVPIPDPNDLVGDCQITADKRVGYVTNFNFQVFQIDLTKSPPALRTGVNPIVISNSGEDLSLSPRGEYLLACDGEINQQLSVILTQKRLEIGTFDLGSDCSSVDVCSNARSTNSSVLVTSSNSNNLRRLKLDSSGKVVDTGDVLGGGIPVNSNCSPLGTAGVVIHGNPGDIQSFTIPGLAPVDTRVPTGGIPASGAFNSAGTLYYVRADNMIDAFTFNQTTGVLGATPQFSIPAANPFSFFGMEQMALHPTQNKLYVSVPGALEVYNSVTGAFITSITSANIVSPTGVCLR